MRNSFTIILLIIFISAFSTLAQRQWTQQNSGTTALLRDVDFVDENIGFAVGNNILLKTTDSGLNWVNWSSVSGDFRALDFLDENLGFIISRVGGEVWKTTDGGQNWATQTFGYPISGISFADNLNGMIATGGGTNTSGRIILKTTDGGETWIEQIVGDRGWLDVFFRNNLAIAINGSRGIGRTTDSGITWDVVEIQENLGTFQAVHWFDENFITVTGDANIVHSTDGGDSWYFSNIDIDDIFGVYSVSTTECTGVGFVGQIIHTTNRGLTWGFDNSGTTADFYGVHFIDSERGIAVGSGGTIVTIGIFPPPPPPPRQWTQQNSGTTALLRDVDFVDENIGFAVGNNILLKTTDSGLNWVNWSSVSGDFRALDFLDENLGFIISRVGGEVWKTTDGGQNWATQTFGYPISGISFADNLNGMIATGGGTNTSGRIILKTTDGGETWIEQIVGDRGWLDVFFRNNLAIAINGSRGIGRTTDSGITWDVVEIQENLGTFQAVHWFDENFITVTGDANIVHSTDGGDSWYFSNIDIDDIFGVYSVSTTECTGVGFVGQIIHTTNRGLTWGFDNSGTTADFYGVHFIDSERGIAVGNGGTIVRTGPVPTFGTISGAVSVNSNGLENVLVKLLDEFGLPVVEFDDVYTDSNGEYSFADVPEGDYQVMILEPLGYVSDGNPKNTTVIADETSVVDFNLTEVVVVNNARSKGYWKHQFDVYVRDRGNAQESEQDLNDYIELVHQHYTLYYDIFTDVNTFEEWQAILSLKGNHPMEDRAKQHLSALILNMVSNKIGQYTVVTDDGRDVGDVIQYVSELIIDGDDSNDELAKDLAESVNNQQSIAAGIVPEGDILYKVSSEAGEVLTYDLENNYPNPFNPSTIIKYQIPNAGFVTLKVYDVLGNVVATLITKNKEPGRYYLTFDAAALSSGVYIYQLKVNDYLSTKKMILMK